MIDDSHPEERAFDANPVHLRVSHQVDLYYNLAEFATFNLDDRPGLDSLTCKGPYPVDNILNPRHQRWLDSFLWPTLYNVDVLFSEQNTRLPRSDLFRKGPAPQRVPWRAEVEENDATYWRAWSHYPRADRKHARAILDDMRSGILRTECSRCQGIGVVPDMPELVPPGHYVTKMIPCPKCQSTQR